MTSTSAGMLSHVSPLAKEEGQKRVVERKTGCNGFVYVDTAGDP